MKINKIVLSLALASSAAAFTTSCSDMLDQGNEFVIYTDGRELTNPADTVTSMLGILNQLQAIGVRTNLLGEVRADLVKVNNNASIDLKNLANFEADVTGEEDANKYNVPRDYYSVINNCNYYLAHADSTAGNTNRNEKYFVNEIAQVHSIRAWVYLQTVLTYGRIPLVTDPVVTKLQSDAQYPMVELADVCDYFIKDLEPYVGQEYPDPQTVGGDVNPKLCFFPTQIVLADLYLWKAVVNHDKESAKQAAKYYYDYIMWDLSGKAVLTMSTQLVQWTPEQMYRDKYNNPSGRITFNYGTSWGAKNQEGITVIPMDSASTSGNYNELRNLYNYTNKTEIKEASISPSDSYIALSEGQEYWGLSQNMDTIHVTRDKFDDEELEDHYYGDLRFQNFYSLRKMNHNNTEYQNQSISKHSQQHICIYRQTQLYLRLAEALNYAGYPRFAKLFLTIGVNDMAIENEVLPYYPTEEDQDFLSYFQFSDYTFITPVKSYATQLDSLLCTTGYKRVMRSTAEEYNMMGIHSRGSGLTYLNNKYGVLETPDSTDYPYVLAQSVGSQPKAFQYEYPTKPTTPKVQNKPSTWDKFPGQTISIDDYKKLVNPKVTANGYDRYCDTVAKYIVYTEQTLPNYEAAMAEYDKEYERVEALFNADFLAWEDRLAVFTTAYSDWYIGAYSNTTLVEKEQNTIDQLILDEQALELAYEGNRFYDLMRRAYWYNDASRLAAPIAKRNPSLEGKLMSRKNWFLHWKGQIGL